MVVAASSMEATDLSGAVVGDDTEAVVVAMVANPTASRAFLSRVRIFKEMVILRRLCGWVEVDDDVSL